LAFIIRIYHDARSSECQIGISLPSIVYIASTSVLFIANHVSHLCWLSVFSIAHKIIVFMFPQDKIKNIMIDNKYIENVAKFRY